VPCTNPSLGFLMNIGCVMFAGQCSLRCVVARRFFLPELSSFTPVLPPLPNVDDSTRRDFQPEIASF